MDGQNVRVPHFVSEDGGGWEKELKQWSHWFIKAKEPTYDTTVFNAG